MAALSKLGGTQWPFLFHAPHECTHKTNTKGQEFGSVRADICLVFLNSVVSPISASFPMESMLCSAKLERNRSHVDRRVRSSQDFLYAWAQSPGNTGASSRDCVIRNLGKIRDASSIFFHRQINERRVYRMYAGNIWIPQELPLQLSDSPLFNGRVSLRQNAMQFIGD